MSKTGRSLARIAVAGAVVAGVPLALSGTATAAPSSAWDALAQCESGGNWAINTGNGYYGGLQFNARTWSAFGGSGMPHQASKGEQIAVAERVLAKQGWNAWPSCSRKTGVRGNTADTSGGSSTVRASAPAPAAAASGGNYTVKSGDTLSKVAAAHGKSWQALAAQNGLSNPNSLRVGQTIAV